VDNSYDWGNCLERLSLAALHPDADKEVHSGFCLSASLVSRLKRTHSRACCTASEDLDYSSAEREDGEESLMCFSLTEFGPNSPSNGQICAKPRQIAANSFCSLDERCRDKVSGFTCARPAVETYHAVVKVTLQDSSFLLYYGYPRSLWFSLTVSDYIPRLWFFPAALPLAIEKTLRYTASISGALGIINMAPIYWLDGQWACSVFLVLSFPSMSPRSRERLLKLILITTAGLFVLNALSAFIPMAGL